MKEKAEKMLKENIIPFWHGLKDSEHGGFYGFVDYDLAVNKKYEKGCILNSRILWFFSNASMTLGDAYLLEDAKQAYDFMLKHCIDSENGGIYWSVNFDGSVKDSTKHTYNQAFAVYALSAYYEASKDKKALEAAWEIFNTIETKCSDKNGYCEAFDRNFNPVSNEKLSENGVMAARTMNTYLHVFEAYSGLFHAGKTAPEDLFGREKIEIAEKSLKNILDKYVSVIFNSEKERLDVFFDDNWKCIIDLHSYGHDIEASWLVDWGTKMLGDKPLSEKIAAINSKLAKNVLKTAWHNNSLWYECENNVPAKYREWWVQAEAVVGFLNEYRKNPSAKEFLDAAKDTLSWIEKYMIDKRPGSEWFWRVEDDGKVLERAIVQPWKCPYHNGRMCFEIINRFGESDTFFAN